MAAKLTKAERERLAFVLALDDDEIKGHPIFDTVAEMMHDREDACRTERNDAVARIGAVTAPLMWSMTGTLPQAVYLAESYIKFLEAQRDMLLQAMWDARTELGFDPDGDEKFHIDTSSNEQVARVAKRHVEEAREFRRDSDDQISWDEI